VDEVVDEVDLWGGGRWEVGAAGGRALMPEALSRADATCSLEGCGKRGCEQKAVCTKRERTERERNNLAKPG